jgi:hypothetical protein
MKVVIDTHLHLYPFYQLDKVFSVLFGNLSKPGNGYIKCAVLTEAGGLNYFRKMKEREISLGPQFSIQVISPKCMMIKYGTDELFLYPGRQIISLENIEILSLFSDKEFDDHIPARQIIDNINAQGALPVLSWAPGKWFFKRGKLVEQLLKESGPGKLLVGDTSLRPVGWRVPRIIRNAGEIGFGIVCGSDPLPLSGQEKVAGSYATVMDTEINPDDPAKDIAAGFLSGHLEFSQAGYRRNISAVFKGIANLYIRKIF